MLLANLRFALPEKIINDEIDTFLPRFSNRMRLAGTAGFEPANAGIKTPCLNQLGDVPVVVISIAVQQVEHGRFVHPPNCAHII